MADVLACVSFFASVIRLPYISHFKEQRNAAYESSTTAARLILFFLVSASKVQRTTHSSVGTTAIQARILLNAEIIYLRIYQLAKGQPY
jgi:hypothetical protein